MMRSSTRGVIFSASIRRSVCAQHRPPPPPTDTISVRNAGRHPATDLETAGTQRVRDGDGYITTGKIQRARRALRHRLRRDVGKPGADALPIGRAAEAMFATLGFNPVPGGVIRAGGHHAVLALTQRPGDP